MTESTFELDYEHEAVALPATEHDREIQMRYVLNPPLSLLFPLFSLQGLWGHYLDAIEDMVHIYLHAQREAVKEILPSSPVEQINIYNGSIRLSNAIRMLPAIDYGQFHPAINTTVRIHARLSAPLPFIDLAAALKDEIIQAIRNTLMTELPQAAMNHYGERFDDNNASHWHIN